MFKNKKGEVGLDTVDYILMTVFVGIVAIIWIIILFTLTSFDTDDREIRAQLITNQIISGKCFSDDVGRVQEQRYTQERLNSCLVGLDNRSEVSVQIDGKNAYYFGGRSDEFAKARDTGCFAGSSTKCVQLVYPVVYEDLKEEIETKRLTVQVLVS